MATADREIKITLRAIVGEFTSGMKAAKTEVKEFGEAATSEIEKVASRGEKLQNVWKDMLEAFAAYEVIEGLKKIAEAANQATDALEIAARVTKNLGKDFDVEEVDSWLRKLAGSAEGGGFAIADMRAAMQQLASTGASEAQQQRLLVDVLGLAAARHMSVAEATHIAMMAAEGHTGILSRYGIQVRDASGELLSFQQIMANWETMVAGAAQKRAEGLEGAFGRVTNAVGQLAIAFGQGLIPWFTAAANALAALTDEVAQIPTPLLAMGAGVTFVTLGLTALGLAAPAVVQAFAFLKNGVLLAVDALAFMGRVIVALIPELGALRDMLIATDLAALVLEAPFAAIAVAVAAIVAVVVEAVRGFKDLKAGWDWFASTPLIKKVASVLFPKLPEMKDVPGADWSGLGGPAKGQQKGIDDWLTAQKAAILGAVDIATQAVAMAQARLEAVTGALSALRDKRDSSEGLTAANVAEERRLIADELAREKELRDRIGDQRTAEMNASRQLADLAKALPANDADRVKHAAELAAESNKHLVTAIKLGGEYDKMQGTVAKIARSLRDAGDALVKQIFAIAAIVRDEAAKKAAIGAREGAGRAQFDFENAHVGTPATKREQAQFAFGTASENVKNAQRDLDEAKQHELDILDQVNAGTLDFLEGLRQMAAAAVAVTDASSKLTLAELDRTLAANRERQARREEAAAGRKSVLDKTVGQIPGVTVTPTGGIGKFDWASVIGDAVSKSKAFADIMQLVNEIMYMFAQIFDALRPVIDALLHVVAMLVNGFITFWNAIARIVSLLGVHISQLQYINTQFGAGTNLVTFFRDIPTLNDLATGNTGGLQAQTGIDPLVQIHADLVTNDGNQKGWFGSLLTAVGGLLAIEWLTGGKFLSGIGGLGGVFKDVGTQLANFWNNLWTGGGGKIQGIAELALGLGLIDSHATGILGFVEKVAGWALTLDGVAKIFGTSLGAIFQQWFPNLQGALGNIWNSLVSGWNSMQNWLSSNLGHVGAGIVDIAGGAALLSMHDTGVAGVLEKILGALLVVQGILQLFGGTGGSGGIGGALGLLGGGGSSGGAGGAGGLGGILGNASKGTGLWSQAGTVGINGALGAVLGTMIGGSGSTNVDWGALGGTLGGLAAAFIPGIGWAGAAGALIGSLFGHKDNPASMPDKYDTSRFGTIIANLQGNQSAYGGIGAQANGTNFYEDTSLQSMFGGQGFVPFIEKTLAQYGSKDSAPAWLQPMYDNLATMFGVDASGSGTVGFGANLSQVLIKGAAAGGGQAYNYTDFGDALTQFVLAYQQQLGGATSSVGASTAPQFGNNYSGASSASAPVQITNNFSGDITGVGDLQAIADTLANQTIQVMQSRANLTTRTAL